MRQRFITLSENAFPDSEAGRRCHVPLRIRQNGLINFKIMGSFKGAILQERPRCSTREKDEAVPRDHEENPLRSAKQIRDAANFPGTSLTFIGRLRDENIHCGELRPKRTQKRDKRLTA